MTDRTKRSEPENWAISTQEAAWLTEIPTKTINATIDRGELVKFKPRRRRAGQRAPRVLAPADVVYLALRKELASVLSSDARSELYEQLTKCKWSLLSDSARDQSSDIEIRLAGGLLRVELKATSRRLRKRWMALRNAKNLVVSDPAIRGGEPVIRGTRVPVFLVADLVEQGASLRELLEDYPALNAAKVRSALAYAQTHPKRGRPKKAPWK